MNSSFYNENKGLIEFIFQESYALAGKLKYLFVKDRKKQNQKGREGYAGNYELWTAEDKLIQLCFHLSYLKGANDDLMFVHESYTNESFEELLDNYMYRNKNLLSLLFLKVREESGAERFKYFIKGFENEFKEYS